MKVAVVGAGTLGGALARGLSKGKTRVTVISRRPVELPALWVQADAVTGEGLRKAVGDAQVVIYAAAGETPKEAIQVARFGMRNAAVAAESAGARMVVVGPAGAGASARHPLLRAHHQGVEQARSEGLALRVVRLPVLFGLGDRLLSPWLDRAARGEAVRIPRVRSPLRPLWTGDATRLVLRAISPDGDWPGDTEVKGPEVWTLVELAAAACESQGRTPAGMPQLMGQARWDHLAEQDTERDDWDTLKLGERQTVTRWLAAVGSRS